MASTRMTALLALLAVAGYQNRDRLGELLGRVTGPRQEGDSAGPRERNGSKGGVDGLLGGLLGAGGGAGLSGGLGDLIENISGRGHREVANSWVKTGPNRDLDTNQLAEALGADTIDQLTRETGLSQEELLTRLKSVLPSAVDKLTPEGRLPTDDEAAKWRS